MGELSKGSGISSIRGGDFELGANGVSAIASSDVVVEDITPILLMPLEDSLELVLGVGTATFTRSTIKNVTDRNTGLVTEVAINDAGFEAEGYLDEGPSSNLLIRSDEFDDAAWGKSNITTIDDGTSFSGIVLWKVTDSLGSGFRRLFQTVTFDSTKNFTISCLVRKGDQSTVAIRAAEQTGSTSGTAIYNFDTDTIVIGETKSIRAKRRIISSGVVRIELTCDFTGTGATEASCQISHDVAGYPLNGFVYSSAFQAEELPFASSYIKTLASPVSRTADNLSIDAANIPSPTADYSVSFKTTLIGLDSSLSQVLLNVDGETSRRIQWNTTTGAIEAIHGAVTSTSTTTFSGGDTVEVAFVVNGTNQTLYINKVQEDQDAKGTATGTATAIDIGHQGGANQAFSNIKKLKISDVALSATQVASL